MFYSYENCKNSYLLIPYKITEKDYLYRVSLSTWSSIFICFYKQQLWLAKINHVIYLSKSQFLLVKKNEDRTSSWKALFLYSDKRKTIIQFNLKNRKGKNMRVLECVASPTAKKLKVVIMNPYFIVSIPDLHTSSRSLLLAYSI